MATVSAKVVGDAFVVQYYQILHHSPELAHRFYQDISTLSRPEADASMSITTTMQAINDKIASLNYGEFRANIMSVDAQDSFNGGVHVLVTGSLTGEDNKVSNFAQTFFLAPQDKGYFVLNDMFIYVNTTPLSPPLVNDDVVPVATEPADGYSIYIMDLPMTASEALLEDVFKKFGTIKKDGIQVRSNRQQQFCFGFVEFEEASSVQKAAEALDVLVDMLASSIEQHSGYYKVGDTTSDSTSKSSDVGLQDNVWFAGIPFRHDLKASESGGSHHSTEMGNLKSELLNALFNMPTPKAAEKEPNIMNWKNIVKKMASRDQRATVNKGSLSMGRSPKKMAREADEKTSMDNFIERNKSTENKITIDLHEQHVKGAMKLLKLHLLFGACMQSVKSFKVITGCGRHSVGEPKLKNSVINLLQNEGISWSEENPGALLVRLGFPISHVCFIWCFMPRIYTPCPFRPTPFRHPAQVVHGSPGPNRS